MLELKLIDRNTFSKTFSFTAFMMLQYVRIMHLLRFNKLYKLFVGLTKVTVMK
ncbi:hypothetical protein BDF20DRAFT_870199 [Mycotypha africana]|uniref:uncharacterized protein n=1 Tax=Mycotypha africana TaxID=64632 RepID=UPI002301B13B|nr:uncharacterized protein BDF20DRAFT_870199 [Mycotypha africana]KAI8979538.1 hypothetical protein BDF20DRAFT_870199 [Mycotypha africana]